jgi:hypothetical protein
MLAITLTAPPHCSHVCISVPKTRLRLCAQVIDWCFYARVFSCPVGNACLVLFRKAGVIVTRCRLFVVACFFSDMGGKCAIHNTQYFSHDLRIGILNMDKTQLKYR